MLAQGSQLAQARPADTNTATAYTAVMRTEISRITVTNTTGTAANMSIFHDDDGTTYDQTTALRYAQSVPANTSVDITSPSEGAGITVTVGGSVGIQSGTSSALTYTFYGITEAIARI